MACGRAVCKNEDCSNEADDDRAHGSHCRVPESRAIAPQTRFESEVPRINGREPEGRGQCAQSTISNVKTDIPTFPSVESGLTLVVRITLLPSNLTFLTWSVPV